MARLRYLSNARTGDKGTVCNGDMAITGDLNVTGTITYDTIDIPISQNLQGTLTVGVDATGYDVKFYGVSSTYYWLWDKSVDGVVLFGTTSHTGNLTMEGTTSYIYFYDSGAAIRASSQNVLALTGTTISLTGAITLAGAIASSGKMTVTPTTFGTFLDFVLEDEWVHGTLINADFGGSTTFDGDVVGINLDLGASVVATSEQNVTGLDINLPQMTATSLTKALYGIVITAQGAFTLNGGTCTWDGVNITLPNITESSGSLITCGLKVTGGTVTSGAQYGIYVAGGSKILSGIYTVITSPTAGLNGMFSYINAAGSAGWSGESIAAVRGRIFINDTGEIGNAYAGVFHLKFQSSQGTGSGLTCSIASFCESEKTDGGQPTASLYLQTISASSVDMSNVPFIVMCYTGAGTNPVYMFELGCQGSGYTVATTTGEIYYRETIKCLLNNSARWIPVSTTQGTYTSAYAVALSLASGAAIDITGPATGIDIGTNTAVGINMTGGGVLGIDFNGTWTGNVIQIGDSSTALTTGTTELNGIYINAIYTYQTGGEYNGINCIVTYDAATSGYGKIIAVSATANIHCNFTGGTAHPAAIRAKLNFTDDAIINNEDSMFSALSIQLKDDATPDFTAGHIAGIYIDNQLHADSTNCTTSFMHLANHADVGTKIGEVFYIYGPWIDQLFYFDTCDVGGQMVGTSNISGGTEKHIKVSVEGVQYYINICTG